MHETPFRTEKFSPLPEASVTQIYKNRTFKELPVDPKSLALFLDRKNGSVDLRVLPEHHRSADTGESHVIRQKKKGEGEPNIYCQFDLKGAGFLFPEGYQNKRDRIRRGQLAGYPEAYMIPGAVEEPWGYNSLGLMDERMSWTTVKVAEKLTEAGLRTEAVAAMYRMGQIYIDGELVDLDTFRKGVAEGWREEARDMKDRDMAADYREMARDVRESFEPVLMIRLMRSVFRLRDLRDAETSFEAQAMIEEACANLNAEMKELGRDERFDPSTPEGRAEWFTFISGWYMRNAGMLHARGEVHLFLHMGNWSLAGEMVDLDSVTPAMKKVFFRGSSEEKASWDRKKSEEHSVFHPTPGGGFVPGTLGFQRRDEQMRLPISFIKDLRDTCFSVRLILKKTLGREVNTKELAERMVSEYRSGLSSGTALTEQGINPEDLAHACERIAIDVVEHGEYYAPIEQDPEEA